MHNEKFMLSDLPDYYVGEEGDLKHYKEVRFVYPFHPRTKSAYLPPNTCLFHTHPHR